MCLTCWALKGNTWKVPFSAIVWSPSFLPQVSQGPGGLLPWLRGRWWPPLTLPASVGPKRDEPFDQGHRWILYTRSTLEQGRYFLFTPLTHGNEADKSRLDYPGLINVLQISFMATLSHFRLIRLWRELTVCHIYIYIYTMTYTAFEGNRLIMSVNIV